MASFPPRGRDEYLAHTAKVRRDPTSVLMTVVADGRVAGNMMSFVRLEKREVGYWIGKEFWGRGIATEALAGFLLLLEERPLYARVAKTHLASKRVLEKCGFKVAAEEVFTDRLGHQIEEFLLRLD